MAKNPKKMKTLLKDFNGFTQEKTQSSGDNGRCLKSYLSTEIFGVNYKEEHYLISIQTLNGHDLYNVLDKNWNLINERYIREGVIDRFNQISSSIKKDLELRHIQPIAI